MREFKNLSLIIVIIYIALNIFYFLNWIPPVPLSLKDAGIYHHVSRSDEQYKVKFEKGSWYQFWKSSDSNFHYQTGDTVFCFAAIFAPTELNKKIVHQWQLYDKKHDEWKKLHSECWVKFDSRIEKLSRGQSSSRSR